MHRAKFSKHNKRRGNEKRRHKGERQMKERPTHKIKAIVHENLKRHREVLKTSYLWALSDLGKGCSINLSAL